jgi:hypothetical protein
MQETAAHTIRMIQDLLKKEDEHMRLTSDIYATLLGSMPSFNQDPDRILLNQEHIAARKKIYETVPRPDLHKESHAKWLGGMRPGGKLYGQIEQELYEFDRMGSFIQKGRMPEEVVLSLWYDVIARMTVLLREFIRQQIEKRGTGYLFNFRWLARRNLEYITRRHAKDEIRLMQKGVSTVLTIEEITEALSILAP